MLAPPCLLLPLLALGQAAPPTVDKVIADADLRVDAAPAPPAGTMILLPAGCPVAATPAHLRSLVLVAALGQTDEELARGRYDNLVAQGQLLSLPEAAHFRAGSGVADPVLKDRAGRPVVVVAGTLTEGRYAGRKVYLLPAQLQGGRAVRTRDQVDSPWAVRPAFGDAEGAAAYAAGAARRAEVYAKARAARGRAKADASMKPAAVRAAATDRLVASALRGVAASEYLSTAALATIIAEGEARDGTADRRAWEGGAARAKLGNDLLLSRIDAALALAPGGRH